MTGARTVPKRANMRYRDDGVARVANGAHSRKISVAPQQVSQSRRNQTLECSSGAFGGTMSVPSPTTQHRARNKRRLRLRIEAATMRTGIRLLAQLVLCGNALAATEYSVDGLAVGTQLDFGSASYREYKCNPSDQFKDLSGAKNQGLIKNGEDLTSSPIHCCIRRTEAFHTSIVLKNQHFSMRRKLNLASSDIRVSSVTCHA